MLDKQAVIIELGNSSCATGLTPSECSIRVSQYGCLCVVIEGKLERILWSNIFT